MNKPEAIKVLANVKACWYRQPTDRLVQEQWSECLAQVEYSDAIASVNAYRDSDQYEPPTPGQVLVVAKNLERQRLEECRRRMRSLEVRPSPQQLETGKKFFRDLQDQLTKRFNLKVQR